MTGAAPARRAVVGGYRLEEAKGGYTAVPGEVAHMLEAMFGLDRVRQAQRGRNALFDAVLDDLHFSAALFRESSDNGTTVAPQAEQQAPLTLVGTGEAAGLLGISSRAVLLAMRRGRLRGTQQASGGPWLIERSEVAAYAARRR